MAIQDKLRFLPEEELERRMEEEVEPYLESVGETGRCGQDGALYYELFRLPEARGTVVISHGFTEASRKFHEFIYYLLQAGYSCAVLDHRGHGRSVREGHGDNVVHIGSFQQYIDDFHTFLEEAVLPGVGEGPLYLYGHSMGGCIAARYLEEHPGVFGKAVLNAPMMGIRMPVPACLAVFVCDLAILARRGDRKLFYQQDFQPEMRFEDDCASSRARFDYYQKLRREDASLQTSAASYRWAKESILAGKKACAGAKDIGIPVLMFQAGDDTLVSARAQERFMKAVRTGQMVKIGGSKHEIYRSGNQVLEKYLRILLEFFDE